MVVSQSEPVKATTVDVLDAKSHAPSFVHAREDLNATTLAVIRNLMRMKRMRMCHLITWMNMQTIKSNCAIILMRDTQNVV